MNELPITYSQDDYSAAHSMDTTWYAVDENGELGEFDTGSEGPLPILANAPDEVKTGETRKHQTYLNDVYRQIMDFVSTNIDDDQGFHRYEVLSEYQDLYRWKDSAKRILNINDLPPEIQRDQHILYLKDFVFKSRDPISPIDFSTGCLTYSGYKYYPPWNAPAFLLPNAIRSWTIEDQIEAYSWAEYERFPVYFGLDDDDIIAMFTSPGLGAIPIGHTGVKKFYENEQELNSLLRVLPKNSSMNPLVNLGSRIAVENILGTSANKESVTPPCLLLIDRDFMEQMDAKGDAQLPEGVLKLISESDSRFAEKAHMEGKVLGAWRDGWWSHWLEYIAGPLPPRILGMFHYDMSWHHAGPYLRIGTPATPLRLDDFPAGWVDFMNPIRFRGIRFAEKSRLQPFEFFPCFTGRLQDDIFEPEYQESEFWISAELSKVELCNEDSIRFDHDDARILRQARAYVDRVEQLFKSH